MTDATALAGALLAGVQLEDLIAASEFDVTPDQFADAYEAAVIRLMRDESARITGALLEMEKSKNRATTIDETIERGMFLLRAFQA